MPAPNPMILWPVRFEQSTRQVRYVQTPPGGTSTINIPLVVGRNYWLSGDGQADADGGVGGVGDLITILANAFLAHAGTATVSVGFTSDFRITFTASAGTHQIMWADPITNVDSTIWGFTGANTSAAAVITAPNCPQGLWRPKKPVWKDSLDQQPIAGGVGFAVSGEGTASVLALPKKERELEFRRIHQTQTMAELQLATEPFGAFESAWVNAIGLGLPFRYYPDESVRTASSYGLYKTKNLARPWKRSGSSNIAWDFELNLRRAD